MVEYDILIRNGLIVTLDKDRRVIEGGFVAISGDRIEKVGKDPTGITAEKIIDAKGKIVMPGLMCSHTHLYGILLRGSTWFTRIEPPSDFMQNLQRIWWPVDEMMDYFDAYASALSASLELLKTGTTFFADTFSGPNAIEGVLDRIEEAVKKVGIRGIISFEATERHSREEGERGLKENIRFIKKVKKLKDPLVTGMICLHASFTVSNELIEWATQVSEELGVVRTMHTSEGLIDVYHNLERYGVRTFERLYKLGFLGPKTIVAHAVNVIDDEIKIIAKTKTNVAHNALSNMLNAVGVAPVPKMIEMGINVTIGNDGYIFDGFENIRATYLIHKVNLRDPRVMTPQQVVEMATIKTAEAYGLADKLGSIEPGKKADIIIIKPMVTATPLNAKTVYGHIVNAICGRDVETVIVNGRILMENRKVLSVDEEEVEKTSQKSAEKLWSRLLEYGKYQIDVIELKRKKS